MRIISFIDVISNYFSKQDSLLYVVENANWVIHQDGNSIVRSLSKQGLIRGSVTTHPFYARNTIIHLGSANSFQALSNSTLCKIASKNKIVATVFHITDQDAIISNLIKESDSISVFHTSCLTTMQRLVSKGIKQEKIKIIPLGVDLALFENKIEKSFIRKQLGIPEDAFVIGSFQKDGVGWEEGLDPKQVKGPDVFVNTVRTVSKNAKVFVLLTGPSRGYVKQELAGHGIEYLHVGYLNDYNDIAQYYKALDVYIIASRIEGGPKQILEAWASGVPVVSTKMGMVSDIAEQGKDAVLCNVEDYQSLAIGVLKVLSDKGFGNLLIANASEKVKNFSWDKIASKYYSELYAPLLTGL